MALIPFLQSHGLPYGWAWFLSQSVFIFVICLILMLSVAAVILAVGDHIAGHGDTARPLRDRACSRRAVGRRDRSWRTGRSDHFRR